MLSLSELEASSQTSCYNRFDLRGNVLVAAGTNQRVWLVAGEWISQTEWCSGWKFSVTTRHASVSRTQCSAHESRRQCAWLASFPQRQYARSGSQAYADYYSQCIQGLSCLSADLSNMRKGKVLTVRRHKLCFDSNTKYEKHLKTKKKKKIASRSWERRREVFFFCTG